MEKGKEVENKKKNGKKKNNNKKKQGKKKKKKTSLDRCCRGRVCLTALLSQR